MATSTMPDNSALKILDGACARNLPLELHYRDPATRQFRVGRTRMLAVHDGRLLTDNIQDRDSDRRIPADAELAAHLFLEGTQYRFDTAIIERAARVALNREMGVRGTALRLPGRVQAIQRREHFRVPCAAMGLVAGQVARAAAESWPACTLGGHFGTVDLVNLSTGGAALLFDRRTLRDATRGSRYFMTLDLPGLSEPVCMLAEVRHTERIVASDSTLVGFSFVDWMGEDSRRARRLLTRVVTDLERRALQRSKR